MTAKISPRLIELTYEAVLKSYWRKNALRSFLRSSHVAETFISSWAHDESKRELLDRLFPKLQASLETLHPKIGTQKGGYEFESWFYDLLDFSEIQNRRPYKIDGR